MKMISLIILLLSIQVFAKDKDCAKCVHELEGLSDFSDFEKLVDALSPDPHIEEVANKICSNFQIDADDSRVDVLGSFESVILKRLNITKETPGSRTLITQYWNTNLDKMVCTEELPRFPDPPKHIMKRVLDLGGTQDFYFGYLLRDRETEVNSIEVRDGKPETIIDYIDKCLNIPPESSNYDIFALKKLRDFLVSKAGAKPAEELLNN